MNEIPDQLLVPRRFCGPPDSGNGGWTAGALATHLTSDSPENRAGGWPTFEVSLRQPPPLDSPMLLSEEDGVTSASFGGAVIASARRVETSLTDVDPVSHDEARAAEATYAGHTFHPFPTCFACGTGRERGRRAADLPRGRAAASASRRPGVRTRASPRTSTPIVDAPARASVATTWAALDCVGGWAGDLTERLMVLGRMTARIDTLPVIGEDHVVVGTRRGSEGRKTFTSATLYDADARIVASAEHIWIAVDPAVFGGVSPT